MAHHGDLHRIPSCATCSATSSSAGPTAGRAPVEYGLYPASMTAMDHALAYEAVAHGNADVIDVYTTDAKIARYGLVVLDDDESIFRRTKRVLVYRKDAAAHSPALAPRSRRLAESRRRERDAKDERARRGR